MADTWQRVASDAQAALLDSIPTKWRLPSPRDPSITDVHSIPRTCGLLTDRQLEITEQTASELVSKLRHGTLSSVQVTEAFCGRAAIAHQCVGFFCLVTRKQIHWSHTRDCRLSFVGQLSHGILPRRGSRAGKGAG